VKVNRVVIEVELAIALYLLKESVVELQWMLMPVVVRKIKVGLARFSRRLCQGVCKLVDWSLRFSPGSGMSLTV